MKRNPCAGSLCTSMIANAGPRITVTKEPTNVLEVFSDEPDAAEAQQVATPKVENRLSVSARKLYLLLSQIGPCSKSSELLAVERDPTSSVFFADTTDNDRVLSTGETFVQLVTDAKERAGIIDPVNTYELSVSVPLTYEESFDTYRRVINQKCMLNGSCDDDQESSSPLSDNPTTLSTSSLKHLLKRHVTYALNSVFCGARSVLENGDVAVKVGLCPEGTTNNKHPKSAGDSRCYIKKKKRRKESGPFVNNTLSADEHVLSIEIRRRQLVLTGWYMKLKRYISQTRWLIPQEGEDQKEKDSSFQMLPSVEEYVCGPLLKFWDALSANFHAAGREDADVRMLGKGRPFVVVINGPKRLHPRLCHDEPPLSLNAVENFINQTNISKGVRIRQLQFFGSSTFPTIGIDVDRNTLDIGINSDDPHNLCRSGVKAAYGQIQQLAEEKEKLYGCVCKSLERELTDKDILQLLTILNPSARCIIQQKTPVRVAHRRSLLTRPKRVSCKRAILLDSNHIAFALKTDAGTYVKEFVHGDFGRTVPSLSSILSTPIHLISLDVLDLCFPQQEIDSQ